jgi:hypothetical protein
MTKFRKGQFFFDSKKSAWIEITKVTPERIYWISNSGYAGDFVNSEQHWVSLLRNWPNLVEPFFRPQRALPEWW